MFIGHFGVGFGAKAAAPQISLGTLFIAAQFLDLLWPTLLLLGLETVQIAPGQHGLTPLVFDHYPISHSLLAVLGWAVAMAILFLALRRDKRGALILAALVVSHWLLDAIVHRHDLPLYPGSPFEIGMGFWDSVPITLAIEVPLFLLGVWLYARTTKAIDATGKWAFRALVICLALIHAGNLFGDPPPSSKAIAWVGQAQWLLVLWGYWVDKHRRVRTKSWPLYQKW